MKEKKESRLNLMINKELRDEFKICCIKNNTDMSKEVTKFIKKFIKEQCK